MYFCCEEHVDLALDIIVDDTELAPVMEKISEENQVSTTCHFCTEKALYKISG